jgi:triosephosphate isomerase
MILIELPDSIILQLLPLTHPSLLNTFVKQVATLTLGVTDVDICVFPPHPFLVPVFDKIEATNVKLGAQNCHFEDSGKYVRASCVV